MSVSFAGDVTSDTWRRSEVYLEDAKRDVEGRIADLLPRREPWNYLYGLMADYPGRDAKLFRPALLLAACEALGGDRRVAMNAAAGIELLHDAFLIHDDIEDGSGIRRGEPTLHRRAGTELAINAGDGLMLVALRAINRPSSAVSATTHAALGNEADLLCQISVEGQALELGWRRDNITRLSLGDYLDMASKKTAWYTAVAPLRIGSLLAGAPAESLDDLVRFGIFLGTAFQVQDDIINLTIDDEVAGKERHGDLWEGKRTPMLIHLLATASPEEHRILTDIYSRPRSERTQDEVEWIRAAMDRHGSIQYARATSFGLAGAAFGAFEQAYADVPDSPGRSFLETLARRVLDRQV